MKIAIDEQRLRRLVAAGVSAGHMISEASSLVRDRRRILREADANLQRHLDFNPAGNSPDAVSASAAVDQATSLLRAAVAEHEQLSREAAPARILSSRLLEFARERRVAI